MGTIFYHLWKPNDKKDKKHILAFLIFDVFVWNFIIVPIAATHAVILPQITPEHIHSLVGLFVGIPI